MNIMVTGVSGGYGAYAIDFLIKNSPADVKLFALVWDESKATAWREKGVEVRIGDYADLPSMERALQGIDRLLFVSVSIPQIQENVVKACKINGVKYIAYTSLYGLEYEKFGLEINHKQTEDWIKQSGIAHTFLRNSWYLEIHKPQFDIAKATGEFWYMTGDKVISGALKKDYAEAGAKVILNPSDKEVLNFTGKAFTYQELGQAMASVLQKKINIQAVDKAKIEQQLADFGATPLQHLLVSAYQDYTAFGNNGEELANPSDLERILGRDLPSLEQAISIF